MQLDELFGYKNELMKTLCCNPEVVRLVSDSTDAPAPNFDLAYTQLFPYEYIPQTVDHGRTYICFDVDISSVENKTFYFPVIYVWIFTHSSKMRLPEGGVRIDKLALEINKELNGSRTFGLGELNLDSVQRFSPADDYQGRVLTYRAKDTNRPSPSKQPPNRRTHANQ